MDTLRLKELEKLAGLRLPPEQQEALAADLGRMVAFLSGLPAVTGADRPESGPEIRTADPDPRPRPLDLSLVRGNAGAMAGDLFVMPDPAALCEPDADGDDR